METREKPIFYKKSAFWKATVAGLIILLVCLLVIGVGLMVSIWHPPAEQPEITEPATLPPPETNPYNTLDFTMDENGYLTCISGDSMLGVDVSYAQQSIDWAQVKAAGVEFAMIRVAGRGWGSEGKLYFDDYWRTNYQRAKENGILVGCYFFSQAITPEEAVEEAEFLLAQLDGLPMDMPIVYDWEYIDPISVDGIPRTVAASARTVTDCTKAFCDTILAAGYETMVYFNADQSFDLMYLEELTDYPFWLASYGTQLNYPYKVDMWQYTESGTGPGIEGPVDINLYLKYE